MSQITYCDVRGCHKPIGPGVARVVMPPASMGGGITFHYHIECWQKMVRSQRKAENSNPKV